MPYNFEMIFTGLCVYHLPGFTPIDDSSSPTRLLNAEFGPAILLVNATDSRTSSDQVTHLHKHNAVLTFDPGDVDDFSLEMSRLEPNFQFINDTQGNPLGVLDLSKGIDFSIELDSEDPSKPFDVTTEGKEPEEGWPCKSTQCEKPPNRHPDCSEPTACSDEKSIGWVAPLSKVDRRIVGLRRECFETLEKNDYVVARMKLDKGLLETRRLGPLIKRANSQYYTLWNFYPNAHGTQLEQTLADQVVLRLEGLKYPLTLHCHGSDALDLRFPTELPDNYEKTVRVSVSNLPVTPDLHGGDLLTHFRWFYELVSWEGGGFPSDLPAPRPSTESSLLGVGGGNGFCPGTTCP